MPCTTSSLTEAQMVPGNGGWEYPLNDGIPPWDLMLSSARASSSPVVTPGSYGVAEQLERLPHQQAGDPHQADLLGGLDLDAAVSHPRSRLRSGLRNNVERLEDALGDLVDLAHAVDLDQDPPPAVDLDQGLGLLA